MRLLCWIGLHRWHPTVPIFERRRLSKLICTRCGTRKWWLIAGPKVVRLTRKGIAAITKAKDAAP